MLKDVILPISDEIVPVRLLSEMCKISESGEFVKQTLKRRKNENA